MAALPLRRLTSAATEPMDPPSEATTTSTPASVRVAGVMSIQAMLSKADGPSRSAGETSCPSAS